MRTIIKFKIVLLILLIFSNIEIVKSQTDTSKTIDLYELDLETLLNLEVTTASKKAQSMSEAPAIVTIITSDQIEDYGVQSLTELMSYVPWVFSCR